MSHISSSETDLNQIVHMVSVALGESRTFSQGMRQVLSLTHQLIAPIRCDVVWLKSPTESFTSALNQPQFPHPTEHERTVLHTGESVSYQQATGDLVAFVPLRTAGELYGWMSVVTAHLNEEQLMLLTILAAQASPILAHLHHSAQQRTTLLHSMMQLGQALSNSLDLASLLNTLYQVISEHIELTDFYIGLYDPSLRQVDLTYIVIDRKQRDIRQRWSPTSGMTGLLYASRRWQRADDYVSECQKRGIEPVPLGGTLLSGTWLGFPLVVHDQFVGVIGVLNRRSEQTYTDADGELVSTLIAPVAVAIENLRLQQRAERQARQLETLNRIGRSITSSLDPERVPSLIMEQARELLGVEEGSLLLADEESQELVFTYALGPIGQQLIGKRLPAGVGLAGDVMRHGNAVIVNDTSRDERFYDETDKTTGFKTRRLLAVPLSGVGGRLGVIEVLNRYDDLPFTAEDQRLLEAIADQAVIALENARKFAKVDLALARRAQELAGINSRLEHNLRSMTALHALGLAIISTTLTPIEVLTMTCLGVIETTKAVGACVLRAEHFGLQKVVTLGEQGNPAFVEQIARRVVVMERPDEAQHEHGRVQTIFAVPLRATRGLLGVVCIFYATPKIDAPEREMAGLFTAQAAATVENLELLNAVSNTRDQMASIFESVREGLLLIDPEARIALANSAIKSLCRIEPETLRSAPIHAFFAQWEQTTIYQFEEWEALRNGLQAVVQGKQPFASGELNATGGSGRSVEWAALIATNSGVSRGGSLLVLRDITDEKEAERMRNDLTHMIVHDLRSPLSSVIASIELLTRGVPGELSDKQRTVLGIANSSSLQMLEMVNTLLDISRLEDGHMPLTLFNTDLVPLVERSVGRLLQLARERRIDIQINLPPDLLQIRADPELIVRVVQNLLGNAIKFSNRGGTVTIQTCNNSDSPPPVQLDLADQAKAFLCIAVKDEGIGIAPQDQDKIFFKFGQVGERRGGTGLGLTFCKLVVEAHGGQIWLKSAPGEGSTFYFTLPIA
jgi:signal transduction histidine kinase